MWFTLNHRILAFRTNHFIQRFPRISMQSSAQIETEIPKVTLESLRFDNKCLTSLPIDPEKRNFVRQVANSCFSRVQPDPCEEPQMVAVSASAMALLGLREEELQRDDMAEYFSGNKLLPGADPAAHCYCGHQFGTFAGQLGDGATMYLGEVINQKNERWEIQFKGAGKTPYSRRADGRKVLRSSIREFLCSEANHFLGIPTTRAGTLVTSNTKVVRDVYYTGNPILEKASIVLRIAPSFLRFGSFEIFKPSDALTGRKGPSVGNTALLHQLLDFAIAQYFPEVAAAHAPASVESYAAMYKEVVQKTARLVALWQCTGFTHGVLNTDNMSILGLTIDYGPFGFMEYYDPNYVPNGSDNAGRYSYTKQPDICRWNLMKLGEALQEALPMDQSRAILEQEYWKVYDRAYETRMLQKLGLWEDQQEVSLEDKQLISSLFDTMEACSSDFTNTFRQLAAFDPSSGEGVEVAARSLSKQSAPPGVLDKVLRRTMGLSRTRMDPRQLQALLQMLEENPAELEARFGAPVELIRRELEEENVKLQKMVAIATQIEELGKMTEEQKQEKDSQLWKSWLTDYAERLKACALEQTSRMEQMNSVNPSFILRNWVAQDGIAAAEAGEFSKINQILSLLQNPYAESLSDSMERDSSSDGSVSCDISAYSQPPSEKDAGLVCTCSS